MNPKRWTNESHFTRVFCEELTKYNCKCTAFVGSEKQEGGIPDRRIWATGLPGLWCEMKKDKGGLQKNQELWIKAVQTHGDRVLIIRIIGQNRIVSEAYVASQLVVVDQIYLPATGKELRAWLIESKRKAELRFPLGGK